MKQDITSLFNNDDTSGRYLKTFLKLYAEGQEPKTVFFQAMNHEFFLFLDNEYKEVRLSSTAVKEKHYYLETFLPTSAWYQIDSHCYFLSSRSLRQWKRSLCSATYEIYSPSGKLVLNTDFLPQIAKLTEEQKDFSLNEAMENFSKGNLLSCRLNDRFAVAANGNIYCGTGVVGKVFWEQKTYKISTLFSDEFSVFTNAPAFKEIK